MRYQPIPMNENHSPEFRQMASDVTEIKAAILGNEKMGHVGLVSRVTILEVWRRNLDLRIAMMSGGVIVVFTIIRYLVTGKL